jgi:hypothetical protein
MRLPTPRHWPAPGWRFARIPFLSRLPSQAYRDARGITTAPGIVQDALRRLDALAVADTAGILKPVRAAAAGEA